MGIKVAWENSEQTAIRFDFEGKWNFLDFDFAVNESVALLHQTSQTGDLIFNMERAGPLATGAVLESRVLRQPFPHNRGALIVAGKEAFAQATATLLSRIYEELGDEFQIAENMQRARELVAESHHLLAS